MVSSASKEIKSAAYTLLIHYTEKEFPSDSAIWEKWHNSVENSVYWDSEKCKYSVSL
ncbi:hypothetical protein [Candidatus Uabimicrobium sp. HlEnr_7]|uniref:hypothetical protein n=1 Tax=Candidatus Uabimicrobium helgolandensis TaxID=3095367 RepID=UPI0035581587